LPFRQIDGGGHTDAIVHFLNVGPDWTAIAKSQIRNFGREWGSGLHRALGLFESHDAGLPNGPRVIVSSEIGTTDWSAIVNRANQNGVSFLIRHPLNKQSRFTSLVAKKAVAENTGGVVVAVRPGSGTGLTKMASWLQDGYNLTIPAAAADDCDLHMLEIAVLGQATSAPFTRCDATPEPLNFPPQYGVAGGSRVVSEPRPVRNITSPAPVSVHIGQYSIGCGSTFTSAPGYIEPGQTICVRHTAGNRPGMRTLTDLFIGGVRSRFASVVAQ
jgi:hypothetical protein